MTQISCPTCGKFYSYSPQLAGKNVRCQSCGHTFLVQPANDDGEGLEVIDAPVASERLRLDVLEARVRELRGTLA